MTNPAKGSFEVQMQPQQDEVMVTGLGRMHLNKRYHGELDAEATGQMLTAMTPVEGSAGYVALELVRGTLHGKRGSFVLQHSGLMNGSEQSLHITVVPDSGTGQLIGLSGTMQINISNGQHFYEFNYHLPG